MDYSKAAAGALIKLARDQAGLSQADLAARAETSQAAIAAYERGARQPTFPTLYRILRAAGVEPRIRLEPYDDHDDFVEAWEASQPAADRRAWRRAQRAFIAARQ